MAIHSSVTYTFSSLLRIFPLSTYLLQDALIDLMSALAIRPKMRILLKTIVRQTVAELLGSTEDLVRMLGLPRVF